MSKKQLVNGVSVKVENRSGFDKSRFNALTTKVGAITPLVKQLVIPNSDGSCRVKISAQLPPLATDAFLRSHLKVEAFFAPLRIAYGGFESWFCGKEIYDPENNVWLRAKLPCLGLASYQSNEGDAQLMSDMSAAEASDFIRGAGSLCDYLGISSYADAFGNPTSVAPRSNVESNTIVRQVGVEENDSVNVSYFNIFPFVLYGLIYDEYYRNKLIERPLFSPPSTRSSQDGETDALKLRLYNLPYISITDVELAYVDVLSKVAPPNGAADDTVFAQNFMLGDAGGYGSIDLLNGHLLELRQRNYGDDYFTAATPSAQEGDPITVNVVDGKFSIASLRMQNALQEFAEVNNFASPDYIQTLSARYGASLSAGIAQKPIYLGSADIPMYSSGVEQTANDVSASQDTNTPFKSVGARYGRAHAESTELVCKFHADEPGYFFVLVSLVPEAQYYQGVDRDMMILNDSGSLVDLPCGLLEHVGNEPILVNELNAAHSGDANSVFGYVQRYLWHKLGHQNEVHGLFKASQNLGSFVVQRELGRNPTISTNFLKVKSSDLDNVAAVSGDISRYGVLIDSSIDLYVSEPLSESALPALSNPAREHGRSVYIKTGGSKLA